MLNSVHQDILLEKVRQITYIIQLLTIKIEEHFKTFVERLVMPLPLALSPNI